MRSPSPPENRCQNEIVRAPPPNGGPVVAMTPAAPSPRAVAPVISRRRVKTGSSAIAPAPPCHPPHSLPSCPEAGMLTLTPRGATPGQDPCRVLADLVAAELIARSSSRRAPCLPRRRARASTRGRSAPTGCPDRWRALLRRARGRGCASLLADGAREEARLPAGDLRTPRSRQPPNEKHGGAGLVGRGVAARARVGQKDVGAGRRVDELAVERERGRAAGDEVQLLVAAARFGVGLDDVVTRVLARRRRWCRTRRSRARAGPAASAACPGRDRLDAVEH